MKNETCSGLNYLRVWTSILRNQIDPICTRGVVKVNLNLVIKVPATRLCYGRIHMLAGFQFWKRSRSNPNFLTLLVFRPDEVSSREPGSVSCPVAFPVWSEVSGLELRLFLAMSWRRSTHLVAGNRCHICLDLGHAQRPVVDTHVIDNSVKVKTTSSASNIYIDRGVYLGRRDCAGQNATIPHTIYIDVQGSRRSIVDTSP